MKAIRLVTTALLAGMLLTGCNKEEGAIEVSNVPVQFSAAITRAAGTAWESADQIGVFMIHTGTQLGATNLASNVKLATTNAVDFIATTPIYYPQSGAVDFVAYHPWRATPEGDPALYKVDLSDQTNPAALDLLYSNKAVNKAKSTTAVSLPFSHQLSRLVLNIKAGVGVTVGIKGMPTTADFSLANGTLSNPDGTTTRITPIATTPAWGYEATYTAIVVPQQANAWHDRQLVFTVSGVDYTYQIPAEQAFASGTNYPYSITVTTPTAPTPDVSAVQLTVTTGQVTLWSSTDSSADLDEVKQIPIPQTVLIPGGTFQMGSPTTEPSRQSNETQHEVTLTKDFYMGKYAVTFAQYDAYCEATNKTKPRLK